MRQCQFAVAIALVAGGASCAGNTTSSTPRNDGGNGGGDQSIPLTCGNGKLETAEECDDGNQSSTDACLNNCRKAKCGDGQIQAGVEDCDDGNTTDGDGCSSTCRLIESLVNAITVGDQRYPRVAVGTDDTIWVVWQDSSSQAPDTNGNTVRLRRFTATGQPKSTAAEEVVPTTVDNDQRTPDIAVLKDGSMVIAWTDWSTTGDDKAAPGVRARRYRPDGTPLGNDFLVNSTTTGPQAAPAIAGLPSGEFWIAFNDTSIGGDSNGTDVRFRRFGSDGTALANDALGNRSINGDQIWPSLAPLSTGGVALGFQAVDRNTQDNTYNLALRIFGANGTASAQEKLIANQQNDQQNVALAPTDSGFVVVWQDGSASGADTDGDAIRVRWFDDSGTPKAADLVLNSTTAGPQTRPRIATRGPRAFVVWQDESQRATQGSDVRGRWIDGTSPDAAGDLPVNATVKLDQARPAVALLSSGAAVVVWESTGGPDTKGYGIQLRILTK